MKSGRFAIGVHILSCVAYGTGQGEKHVSSVAIAASINTNAAFVRELLGLLREAGLVVTKEGSGGGVRLARAASRINLRDIYLAVGERLPLPQNTRAPYKACPVSCGIKSALEPTVKEVESAILGVLGRRKLSDLVKAIRSGQSA